MKVNYQTKSGSIPTKLLGQLLRFVGENPSDAEVQVEKLYSKFETDNLQYFNTDWTGPDGKITQKCFYLRQQNSRPRDKASSSLSHTV